MFTPQEIQERTEELEKAVFGGYSVGSVDELLEQLTEDYTSLYKENAVLKSKMKVLVDRLEEYRDKEDSINRTLIQAQRTADEMVAEAERRSSRMVTESEQKLRGRSQELRLEIASEQERVTMAKQSAAKFIAEIEDRVQSQLAALERIKQMDLTTAAPAPGEKKTVTRMTAGSTNPLLRRAVSRQQTQEEPPAPQAEDQEATAREIEEHIRGLFEGSDGENLDSTQVMEPVED